MSRLVTFGCSCTYGLGLPDCLTTQQPSNYSWTRILSDKLNKNLLNKAIPGSSNKEIFNNVLDSDFNEDDIVILAWTFFDRIHFYYYKDFGKGARVYPNTKAYKEIILQSKITDSKWKTNTAIENFLLIQHCDLFLKNLNILAYHFIISTDVNLYEKPKKLMVRNFLEIDNFIIDKADDNSHPGLESNKLLASLLHDKITA